MNPAYETYHNDDWTKFAACNSRNEIGAKPVNPELFFNSNDQAKASFPLTNAEKEAIRVCGRCPVSGNCLMYAMEHNQVGIWGGMPFRWRKLLRRPSWRRKCLRCQSAGMVTMDGVFQACISCGLSWRGVR